MWRAVAWGGIVAVLVVGVCAQAAAGAVAPPGGKLRQTLAWQLALDRAGFSPGMIDGKPGPKTALAIREFQRVRGLPVTGRPDPRTAEALRPAPDKALTEYVVQPADVASVDPAPKGWLARSREKRLGYESLSDALAERFHCARGLLATLNPGRDLTRLKAGDRIVVPDVSQDTSAVAGQVVEIDFSDKVVRVIDSAKRLAAMFHCSIAADKAKRPSGSARVATVAMNPAYTFDPKKWPEVKGVDRKLQIPPGPRNPVGRCWIGLSLPGYGIHGTPRPELIGKTGSHGCFRLANWDAVRLSKMVRVGTPVRFSM